MNSIIQELLNGQVNIDELIKEIIRDFLETILEAELTEHLGYSKYDAQGKNSGNSRNGSYKRNLKTKYGEIEQLKVPRDRNGEFDTILFQSHQRQDNWLEEMIVNMYARGLSTRDIADIIEKLYGSKYSPASVSNITSVALEELEKWHNRPLKKRYSIIFIDAMSIKIRRDYVDNESVYLIIGIDENGYREILDFYIGVSESSSLWEEILLTLKTRGLEQVLLGVMDGLPGLTDTFLKVFPKADVQRCVVHKVRNSLAKVRNKDSKELAEDMKLIYESTTLENAEDALNDFIDKWKSKYSRVTNSWLKDKNELLAFFKYPNSIRKSIYTTNWIERTNKEIRKRTKTTNSLPNLEAAEKLIYLQVNHYNEKWSNRIMKGYKIAQEKLQQFFEERYQ